MDVQNDFLPGGALAVPAGDSIIAGLNKVIAAFAGARLPIFFTRDWHPSDHCSFSAEGGIWPPHCLQGTPGAEISAEVLRPRTSVLVNKGYRRDEEAYSGFQGTDLAERLHGLAVTDVFIGGLSAEYCVRTTTEDAIRAGFAVHVILDCISGLEVHRGDSESAIEEMKRAGASAIKLSEALRLVGAQQ